VADGVAVALVTAVEFKIQVGHCHSSCVFGSKNLESLH
jgi:hypothetical protein